MQVLADIAAEAVSWTTVYSKFLQEDATSKLHKVEEKINEIRHSLEQTHTTMEEFKHLLQVIMVATQLFICAT